MSVVKPLSVCGVIFINPNPNPDFVSFLSHTSDMKNILNVLSIRNFNADIDIVAQLASGDNRKAIVEAGVNVVCCADEITMRILAKNTLCPGFGTFIINMVTMLDESDESSEHGKAEWLKEYERGLVQEFYYVDLNHELMRALGMQLRYMKQ
jgi:hypothetical protein